ncbi:dual specificity phosphatase domain protein (macronuclear) [Tetrahymena thermophila SB210]|uniref:protein-tyrosine-phosphatase n=1 Tax=Tetrahymena thermophila (strain SB210) TaxID=312017 RepID=I7LVA3_TETTS|nr:dual specificity phosphatase domain protein [Tetrahymena thermophila SB210]EAR97541.1 dual specificity phosphatase domain protein [Tetrahymena thermophila SB210]|eukprot:XP_001017786.1 dual specificity phosphatase domain protein [Tetrahymena thermophila SB210]
MYLGKSGHCILEPNHERGGLYLSNLEWAKDYDLLREHKIRYLMTVGAKLTPPGLNRSIVDDHIKFEIYDTPTADIKQFFKQATLFLKEKILEQKQNVLVHCHQGASRSATIVIAFLMKCLKWNYDRSYSHIKRIRNVVQPNKGFVNQLKMYEKELGLAKKQDQTHKKGKKSTELQRPLGQEKGNEDIVDQSEQQREEEVDEYEPQEPSEAVGLNI